jgi:hypothetical protein
VRQTPRGSLYSALPPTKPEAEMIVIRDVFRLKFGKTREALAAFKMVGDHLTAQGRMPSSSRVLTDLVGPYYTLVLEMTAAGLGEYEQESQRVMQDPEWRTLYQKFTPFVESGYREIFSIVA